MRLCLRCGTGFSSDGWRCPQCAYSPPAIDGFPAFAPDIAGGGAGFNPAHFAEFARLEAGNFWFRARNRLITWAIGRHLALAKSFLEVGCGTGYVLSGIATAFPGMRLAASEAATAGLAFAAARVPGAVFLQTDARRIPFREEFDAAGAFDVIEHIEDDRRVLSELRAAVVPGGGVVLTVPQHPFLWSGHDVSQRHVRRYTARELRDKAVAAGLEIIRMTSFVTLLLPFMLLSRSMQRRTREDYESLAELKVPAWLNLSLERVLDLERGAIRAGLDLPLGGSLLMVARRPG